MKNILSLIIFSLIVLNTTAQLALPNSGFESWTNGNPDQWFTNNVVGTATPVTKSTDAHSGSFALRGDVIMFNSNRISPNIGTPAAQPFPINQQYTTFNFYYKLHKVSASDGIIFSLTASDSANFPVAYADIKISTEATTYTPISIPVTWIGANPQHINFVMSLEDTTGAGGTIGSYFLIDDVSMGGFVTNTGINETTTQAAVSVFPNPASQQGWNITVAPIWLSSNLQLLNMQGQTVYTTTVSNTQTLVPANVPAGIYLLRLTNGQSNFTTKLVKE